MLKRVLLLSLATAVVICVANIGYSQSPCLAGEAYEVNLNSIWTNTGLQVNEGDTLLIIGRGTFEVGPGGLNTDAWGIKTAWGEGAAFPADPVPEGTRFGLIGKIGNDGPGFYIGGFKIFTADTSGPLYLGVNDSYCADNSGTLVGIVFGPARDPVGLANQSHSPARPSSVELNQNYPNPFNPATTINYMVATEGKVSLKVYNVTGQLVRSLINETKRPGNYRVRWDGKNDYGVKVASGTYFYQLIVGDFTSAKKAILLK